MEIKKKRTIQLYEKKQGTYNLKETLDFEKYLKREGYKIYKIDEKDQLEYLINFVHIGNNEIISVNKKIEVFTSKIKSSDQSDLCRLRRNNQYVWGCSLHYSSIANTIKYFFSKSKARLVN